MSGRQLLGRRHDLQLGLLLLAAGLGACGGGGRLRLGTARPPRPKTAAQPQPVHVLDLRSADQLAIGDRYLDLGYNFRAKREYMRVIEMFPGSTETAVAQFKIGNCYLREEMYAEALEQYQLFLSNFPKHHLAQEARRKLGLLKDRTTVLPTATTTAMKTTAVKTTATTAGTSTAAAAQSGAAERERAARQSLSRAQARQQAAEQALAEARRGAAREAEARRRADEGRAAAELAMTERTSEVTKLRQELNELRAALQGREAADSRAAETVRKWRAALGQAAAAEHKLAQAERRLAALEQELATAKRTTSSPAAETAESTRRLAAAKQAVQAAEQRAAATEKTRQALAEKLRAAEARATQAAQQVAALTERAEQAELRASRAVGRAAEAERRREAADQRAAEEAKQRIAVAEARAKQASAAQEAAEARSRQDAEARAAAETRARQEATAREAAEARARATAQDAGSLPGGETRTVAAQVLHLPCRTLAEVEQRFQEMARAGVNTVILRVFHNPGDRAYGFVKSAAKQGVYFRTDRAPVLQDALGEVLPLARKAGLKVWAWMTTRYATYGLNLESGWRAARYDFETGSIVPAKGLNLFHPQVQEHLAGLFRDLAAYEIDGVLFQDDLVLRHTEGMSAEARRAFAAEMGRPLDPRELYEGVYLSDNGKYYVSRYTQRFWDWAAWKNRKVLQLAERLMTSARGVRPGLRFGINLMYEAVVSPRNALAWLAQSVAEARKVGFDLYSVMAYHRQMRQELGLSEKETAHLMAKLGREAVRMVGDPTRVLVKIQTKDWESGERVPVVEQEEMIGRVLAAGGAVSLALVPVSDGRDLEVLSKVLARRTQAAER